MTTKSDNNNNEVVANLLTRVNKLQQAQREDIARKEQINTAILEQRIADLEARIEALESA